MTTLSNRQTYPLADLLEYLRGAGEGYVMDPYDLYVADGDDRVRADLKCTVSDEGIEGDEDGGDVYPDFLAELDLAYFCSGQLIEDVVRNARHQTRGRGAPPTVEELVRGLEFYLEWDTFRLIEGGGQGST